MNILLGAHTSIAGGFDKAIDRADLIGCSAIQIFTKNSNQWKSKSISADDVQTYKNKLKKSKIKKVIAHDSYLINLSANTPQALDKAREAFIDELSRCEQLDIEYLNFHPGAHLGIGEDAAIRIIAESINISHRATEGLKVKTMLEMTAGQGSSIGYKFEHMRDIISQVNDKKRMAVCIDTCHIFAAGYDIRDEILYNRTFDDFDKIIGLKFLKAFHLNDSKKDFGSRVDRHEHIGKGFIGLNAFRLLMNDQRFINIPKVLETPKGTDMKEDIENMDLLKSLINQN